MRTLFSSCRLLGAQRHSVPTASRNRERPNQRACPLFPICKRNTLGDRRRFLSGENTAGAGASHGFDNLTPLPPPLGGEGEPDCLAPPPLPGEGAGGWGFAPH